jgi:UDP-2,3-diacylglucosamine pyrophosphatase LpxH
MKWLAHLGDLGYTFLLWLNKRYNQYRTKRGLPYYSLSQAVKLKVKSAVNYISDFEQQLAELARIKGCDGIICGHIHQPAIRQFGEITYLNSGDWVESMSALVQDNHHEWSLVYYTETSKYRLEEKEGSEAWDDAEEEMVEDSLQQLVSLQSKAFSKDSPTAE